MKRTIILISAWVIGFSVFAQLEIGKRNEQPNIPTWESYEFMKYGKVGASLYTGTINYSLPIYTYKDQDFELPITLEYATNGFRVNHSSGLLGHGWKLSCTGRITRKIRGIPDEIKFYGSFFQSGISYDGFSYLSDTLELYPQLVYKNEGQIYTGLYDEYDNRCYETEADEYSFDFCGYTGSFQRNRNNSIKDGQVFFIYDASDSSRGLMIQTEGSLNSSVPESFIITDINGYKYRFSVGEYILYRKDNSNPPNTEAIPISWNLDMIIAPNGRTISFNYSDIPNTKFGNRNDEIIHQNMSYYFMSAVCNNVPIGLQSSVNEVHNTHVYKNRLDSPLIDQNIDMYPEILKQNSYFKKKEKSDENDFNNYQYNKRYDSFKDDNDEYTRNAISQTLPNYPLNENKSKTINYNAQENSDYRRYSPYTNHYGENKNYFF